MRRSGQLVFPNGAIESGYRCASGARQWIFAMVGRLAHHVRRTAPGRECMFRIALQVVGLFVLLLCATIVTLKLKHQSADGPSILFPGGELVSGELYSGPEPDWRFTDDVGTIELQLEQPLSSRRIFVMESGGKVYVPSGYMRSFLGRLWKDWAFEAAKGDGFAVARINGVRYARRLVRVQDPEVIQGVAEKLAQKYAGGATPEAVAQIAKSVADGDTWIFEMAPRMAPRRET
jgi:hypothetical protein